MMVHFLKALFDNRHKLINKHYTVPNEINADSAIVFSVDKAKREYLINRAYKDTEKWERGRVKRLIAYILLLAPLVLYTALFVIMGFTDTPWSIALVDASPVPLILMIVLWPVALTMLKAQYHNAKIIPEDRRGDRLALSENGLVYTYFCTTDGHTYTSEMRYKDISKMEVSVARKTLYVFGACQTLATKGKKSELAIYTPYITVPLYFQEQEHSLCDALKVSSGKEIICID